MLAGGGALAGGVLGAMAGGAGPAAAATGGQYLWAVNDKGVAVPTDRWTRIPWTHVYLNTTQGRLEKGDPTSWVLPRAAAGIYNILCNIAWDNTRSANGSTINPPTHRKMVRIPQQPVTRAGRAQPAYTAAAQDLTYSADFRRRDDQRRLSDGSLGYQQQQVTLQAGWAPTDADQRFWIEVYQSSGQTLVCRWDGTGAPGTPSRPPMIGLQAPSLMITKMCEW